MLGHASIQQPQRYLNVSDEELRKGSEVSWNSQGAAAPIGGGKLTRSELSDQLSPICPRIFEKLARRTRRFPQLAHPRRRVISVPSPPNRSRISEPIMIRS